MFVTAETVDAIVAWCSVFQPFFDLPLPVGTHIQEMLVMEVPFRRQVLERLALGPANRWRDL